MTGFVSLNDMIKDLQIYFLGTSREICMPECCLIYVLESSLLFTTESKEIWLHPNQFCFVPPGKKIRYSPYKRTLCLILRVPPEFLIGLSVNHRILQEVIMGEQLGEFEAEFSIRFLEMARAYLDGKKKNRFVIMEKMYASLEVMSRSFNSDAGKELPESHSEKRAEEILSYVEAHVMDSVQLQEAAEELQLTPQYLASWFRKNTGDTFLEYYTRKKVEKSRLWLQYTETPEKKIGEMFHFRNLKTFREQTVRYLGKEPEELRNPALAERNFSYPPKGEAVEMIREYEAYFTARNIQLDKKEEKLHKTETIEVESGKGENMSDSWRYILNAGFASDFKSFNFQKQIRDIQQKIHFKYCRISRLFDLIAEHDLRGKNYYGFENIFYLLDYIRSLDMIPFLELGYKVVKIHKDFTDTNFIFQDFQNIGIDEYYRKLLKILPHFIRESINRYGILFVEKWKFEIFYDFVQDSEKESDITFWQYANYLQEIQKIIKTYLCESEIGGIGFNTYLPLDMLQKRMDTLDSMGIELDFLSFYVYAGIHHDIDTHLSTDSDFMICKTKKIARYLKKRYPNRKQVISEFNFCYTSRNYLNDTVFQSCFVAKYLSQCMSMVHGMGYFLLSDISLSSSDTDELLFGGNGIYSCKGNRKPVFYTFAFLSRLDRKVIENKDGALITSSNPYRYRALFYNYTHISHQAAYSERNELLLTEPEQCFEQTEGYREMRIHIDSVIPGSYIFRIYTTGSRDGNLFGAWSECRPVHDLDNDDISFLKYLSHPSTRLEKHIVEEDGILDFTVRLRPLDIQLVLIDRS